MTTIESARLRCALSRTLCALSTLLFVSTGRAAEPLRLALDGYCPVSITADKQWKMGDPELVADYDGCEYHFATEECREQFLAAPGKYVPAFRGDCIVSWETKGKRVQGQLAYGAFYGGRLLLFANAHTRETFRGDSGLYATADLAYGGRSPIALVDEETTVRGEPEIALHHRGFRYQFASVAERETFQASPEKYMVERREVEVAAAEKTVAATGKSACAFCDYKVWPMLTKGELGLAVEAEDGTVYIVEHADTKFPELYNDRFDGITLTVRGREIKREGKFVWVVPVSLLAGT